MQGQPGERGSAWGGGGDCPFAWKSLQELPVARGMSGGCKRVWISCPALGRHFQMCFDIWNNTCCVFLGELTAVLLSPAVGSLLTSLVWLSRGWPLLCCQTQRSVTWNSPLLALMFNQGAAKVLIFPVVQQFTEAFVQALQMPDGPTSDSGFKMEVLKVSWLTLIGNNQIQKHCQVYWEREVECCVLLLLTLPVL